MPAQAKENGQGRVGQRSVGPDDGLTAS